MISTVENALCPERADGLEAFRRNIGLAGMQVLGNRAGGSSKNYGKRGRRLDSKSG